MDIKQVKHELQAIISGKSGASHDALIQTVLSHLGGGKEAGPMDKGKHENKEEEKERLIQFAIAHDWFYPDIDESNFISSGAEQRVYIKDHRSVIKLNDAIYYASWVDYFHNLLLNNYFFADTAYHLLGFHLDGDALYAVVHQKFVQADTPTDLAQVKAFLVNNGFINTRNHDYQHPGLGIILEDLHDENVLTYKSTLYFIDTVFYIQPTQFWKG